MKVPQDPEEAPKAKARSVSLHPDLWRKVNALVKKDYSNIRSRYFQELVQADLARREYAQKPEQPAAVSDLGETQLDALVGRFYEKLEAKLANAQLPSGEKPAKDVHRKD